MLSSRLEGEGHPSQSDIRLNLPRTLAILVVFSFAFDFRGSPGGSVVQFGMAGFNAIAFLALALHYRLALPSRGWAAVVFWGWVAMVAAGIVAAYVHGVPNGRCLRTAYPFALFGEGFLVAWWMRSDLVGRNRLMAAMLGAAFISFLFTVIWGFYFTGRALEAIRFHIISPVLPFTLVTAAFGVLAARRDMMGNSLALLLAVGVVALSLTRGMLVVVLAVGMAVGLAWILTIAHGRYGFPRPILRAVVWGSLLATCSLIAAWLIEPSLAKDWMTRSLGEGRSITLWTRMAAVVGQWEQFRESATTLLFGLGFGHSYQYSAIFAPVIVPAIPAEMYERPMWYPGEFMWVTPVYYSGILFGALGLIALLVVAGLAVRCLALLIESNTWRSVVHRSNWLGTLGYFAMLGLTFTANPLGSRLGSLYFGLCAALAMVRPPRP